MPAIFISHSSLDQTIASELTAAIKHLGFEEVFLDFDKDTGIGAGADWARTLYEKLSRCHAVVLNLTPNWLASKWCFAELQQARALGKVILPVIFSPLGDGYVLPEIQAIDLIDWKQDGITRLKNRLNDIMYELARGYRLEPGRPPYPGIHAFEAEDAAIYFGRDDETRAVIEKLDASRGQGGIPSLLVIGASGAGKSSLLKAGVLPQLARRRDHWLLLPVMRPEKNPLEALAKVLAQRLGENDWRALHDDLGGRKAVRRIERIVQDLRVGEGRAATVLLPIDQFEELFTIAEPGERAALLTLLAAILDPVRGLPVMMIATGRADVLQGLLEASPLAPLLDTTPLLPMPLERVPLLVEGPAAVASLIVEKELPQRIMRDVENPEALPLLAYMLHLLHQRCPDKRLTLATYLTLGEENLNPVHNAIHLGAEEAIARVRPTEQEMAALRDSFIPHLVRLRLDDNRHVRQPAPLAALPREAGRLIQALVKERLLTSRTSDRDVPVVEVEVVHEALFSAWPTLKDWLAREQDFLADIERLKGAYETWKQAAEAQKPQALLRGLLLSRARDWLIRYPQRFAGPDLKPIGGFIADSAAADDADRAHSQRLRRRVFQAMVAAVGIFAALAAFAWWLYVQANDSKQAAERNLGLVKRAVTSDTLVNIADARRAAGDLSGALAAYRDALVTRRDLVVAMPDDPDWKRTVGATNDRIGDVLREQGHLKEALQPYTENVKILNEISRHQSFEIQIERDRSAALNKVGDVSIAIGDLIGAQQAFRGGQDILRRIAAIEPDNLGLQFDLAMSQRRNGDVRAAANDLDGALAAYQASLDIVQRLARVDVGNAQFQAAVGSGLGNIGDVQVAGGNLTGARDLYEESLNVLRSLSDADPGNARWQREVVAGLNKLGDVLLRSDETTGARDAYESGIAAVRKLAGADPTNALLQHDLSVGLDKIGHLRLDAGDRTGAFAAFQEDVVIARKLAAADPGNAGWQADYSVSLVNVGDVKLADGDRIGGREAYQDALAVRGRLAGASPSDSERQRDVAFVISRIGDAWLPDNRAAALAAYQGGLAMVRKLAAGDAGNAGWQADLFICLFRVAKASNPTFARQSLTEALSIAEGLARRNKLAPFQSGWPQQISNALASLPADDGGAK